MEFVLGFAAFCFLMEALDLSPWHWGRLRINAGWLGLTIWGVLATLQAAFE